MNLFCTGAALLIQTKQEAVALQRLLAHQPTQGCIPCMHASTAWGTLEHDYSPHICAAPRYFSPFENVGTSHLPVGGITPQKANKPGHQRTSLPGNHACPSPGARNTHSRLNAHSTTTPQCRLTSTHQYVLHCKPSRNIPNLCRHPTPVLWTSCTQSTPTMNPHPPPKP